ncbi:MAG TPA: flavin reductase family protein [Acidimicrobiia bacterium]|nr:flavin reductase family protein [Acidimicrobiia bacterium]
MDPKPPTPDGARALVRLAAGLDPPMAIVTTREADGSPTGCLVGFWTQCSIHPGRVLVCVSKANHTYPAADRAEVLAVHYLGGEDRSLAELFGGETGDEVDKFERCSWRPGPADIPVIDGVKGWVAGPVVGKLDAGDHVALVVEARWGAVNEPGPGELGFQAVKDIDPGHEA